MKLLLTKNKKPLHVVQDDFLDAFEEFSSSADSVHISTGYVSVASLQYLIENVKNNALSYLHLTIGMHHFDGFTRAQYDSAFALASYLEQTKKGSTSICKAFPYHGKVYGFYKNGKPFATILGSSNLSSLCRVDSYNFEVDVILEDLEILNQISEFQTDLNERACEPFLNWQPREFNKTVVVPFAKKLSGNEFGNYLRLEQREKFSLLLMTEEKSNLNVCFGKGRENKRKFVRPRPWYEVEVIVSKAITALPGYPYKTTFKVVTDDGWMFDCNTNGDYSKNFRSADGLCVLGHWIKGRLEADGVLKFGEKVTKEILQAYGTEHLKLIKTEKESLWLLNFEKSEELSR